MSETPPFSPTVALLALSRQWEASLSDAFSSIGLTTRKFGLLGHIQRDPGISFSDLARRSRITVQSAHAAVAALVEAGWVEDASARAGAASRLDITPQGGLVLAAAAERLEGLDASFVESSPGLAQALHQQTRDAIGRRQGG